MSNKKALFAHASVTKPTMVSSVRSLENPSLLEVNVLQKCNTQFHAALQHNLNDFVAYMQNTFIKKKNNKICNCGCRLVVYKR